MSSQDAPGGLGVFEVDFPNLILLFLYFRTNITVCSVLIGTNKLNSGGMVYYPKKYVIHSEFHNTPENDIALIQLKDKIEFISKSIKIVELTSVNTKPHTEVIVSGWGYTNVSNLYETFLQP